MTIAMTDWQIDPVWVTQMNAVTFNGNTFTAILQAAMQRLINSFGQDLLDEATVLINANAQTPQFPFGATEMNLYLRDGEFKYNRFFTPPNPPAPGNIAIPIFDDPLVIEGPTPTMGSNINGQAGINGGRIALNFPVILAFAVADPSLFPANNQGQARLEVLIGKTILHEMMHNHGFRHPVRPAGAYNPVDQYWRTFPEVSEQAYFRLNQVLFPSLGTILNLSGNVSGLGECGTV
jgi:hypothetical protein